MFLIVESEQKNPKHIRNPELRVPAHHHDKIEDARELMRKGDHQESPPENPLGYLTLKQRHPNESEK